jgi:hypothetical protein
MALVYRDKESGFSFYCDESIIPSNIMEDIKKFKDKLTIEENSIHNNWLILPMEIVKILDASLQK